jgi:hypothetical protein
MNPSIGAGSQVIKAIKPGSAKGSRGAEALWQSRAQRAGRSFGDAATWHEVAVRLAKLVFDRQPINYLSALAQWHRSEKFSERVSLLI